MTVDKGSQIASHDLIDFPSKVGVKNIFLVVGSHKYLAYGERYHDPLESTYRKIRYSKPYLISRLF